MLFSILTPQTAAAQVDNANRWDIAIHFMLLFLFGFFLLLVCLGFLLFYRHKNENSAQDTVCVKQYVSLGELEHWAFADGSQTDPELWQPRKYS